MHKIYLFITISLGTLFLKNDCNGQGDFKPDKNLVKIFNKNFTDAAAQYKFLSTRLPADKFPKTFFPTTNKYEHSNSGWWCSGFYPGTLLFLFEQTKDSSLYKESMRILKVLEKEKLNTGYSWAICSRV